MRKRAVLLLIAFLLFILSTCEVLQFGIAQAFTPVSGIISSNATWTQANSPYNLTGNVLVDKGVTLTIEPGATVNLDSYYIRVNGTLIAIGNPTNKITFNGGQITFTTASNGWNEQAQSGCIIKNAIINHMTISNSNPIKIDNCIINGDVSVTSSSIISNSIVTGNIGSLMSTISNNNVKGDITVGSVTLGGFTTAEESSTVSGNIVEGSINSGSPNGIPQISNNSVSKGGITCTGYGSILNNYVHSCGTGISLSSVRVFGGYLACFATVENNVVVDNTNGITIYLASLDGPGTLVPTVQNNTITGNSVGISLDEMNYGATPIIRYNNLQNNSNYNFYLGAPNNVDVSHNWWGTINEAAINQSIYDFKNDFNLGKATFIPFLTEPNPYAGSIPEFPSWTILLTIMIGTLATAVYFKKRKRT